MREPTVQRRLAAILAADVVGYTRLMEEDTDSTVAAWQAAREDVIKPQVGAHSGNIIKLTGDGFLPEFSSAQEAVNCAIAMQTNLSSNNLDFRMGIDLGDIIDDGEDIHGEGVNLASRLEGLAEPAGICISGETHALVRNRIDVPFQDLGEHMVKHVTRPVRGYAIYASAEGVRTDIQLPTNDKPSIAVLPFDNLSGDVDQDVIGDGLVEDIITSLSSIRSFFVIARNSTYRVSYSLS